MRGAPVTFASPREARAAGIETVYQDLALAPDLDVSALVLNLIKRVRDAGTPVVLISHNLPHVYEAADRMIVLRHGSRVGTLDPKASTMDEAVSLMTGAVTASTDAY